MNLNDLYLEYSREWSWRPAYNPRMVLKVSLDWTKIYANVSKTNNYDIEWLDKKIKDELHVAVPKYSS